jgi:hypothetical protein
MHSLGRAMAIVVLTGLVALSPAHAQQRNFPYYQQAPVYQSPPVYQPPPAYQPSYPQYLPNGSGGPAGTFNPSAPPGQSPVGCFYTQRC